MQNNASKVTRSTYHVPEGEEQSVHYTIEKVSYNQSNGSKVSHERLVKTDVKLFDEVKRNLELQGYTITILHHPENRYVNAPTEENHMDEKDEEIARLRAALAEKESNAIPKEEENDSKEVVNEDAKSETATEKKAGRPKKNA